MIIYIIITIILDTVDADKDVRQSHSKYDEKDAEKELDVGGVKKGKKAVYKPGYF